MSRKGDGFKAIQVLALYLILTNLYSCSITNHPSPMLFPIFPLNVVLFPGAYLPLYVFEDRYRLMMRHCLNADRRFGVVLIRSGSEVGDPAIPEGVGTIARIDGVKPFDDGRMVIRVKGEERFRIVKVVERLPYLKAEVEILQDNVPDVDQELMSKVTQAAKSHLGIIIRLRGEWVPEFSVPADPVGLCYFVGSQLQGDVISKQGILEAVDTRHALEVGLRLLDEETSILKGYVDGDPEKRVAN